MDIRSFLGAATVVALFISPLLQGEAHAAGVEVTITATVLNETGTGESGYALFVNGSPLATSEEPQIVSLNVGDVLRVEATATAVHDSGAASSHNLNVRFDLDLDGNTGAAELMTSLNATANATPESAQVSAASITDCAFTIDGCSLPDLPGSFSFISGAQSSTFSLVPNSIIINNVETETGRVGGTESLELNTRLLLDRSMGDPIAAVAVQATALAIFQSSGTANANLELAVSDLTPVVPVPAAVWLFGSALGLLGWMRRRQH